VSAYSLDANTGALTAIENSPFSAGTHPAFSLLDPTGKFLFVCNQGSKNITRFTIDADTGALSNSAAIGGVGSAPTSMAIAK